MAKLCFFFHREFLCASNPHGHNDVAILEVVLGVFGTDLAGGLGVFEFQPDLADFSDGPQEIDHVGGIESNHQRVHAVRSFDGVFGFPGLSG